MKNEHFGAQVDKKGNCTFRVFAPHVKDVVITLNNDENFSFSLENSEQGFHNLEIKNLAPDTTYSFTFDGTKNIPDPASLWQPEGLNSSSKVIDHHKFDWQGDNFSGLPINEMVIYEAHVGAFSNEGTLAGLISKLDHLAELGINTIELMPVSQLSGSRGWGEETIFPFAVHSNYGTPDDLKTLIRESHKRSLAVVLDMALCQYCFVEKMQQVYAPFFSETYNTKYGKALNFDEKHSNGVRDFYIQCALSWLRDYHVDGLRINNAYSIHDRSPIHFLQELSSEIRYFESENNRKCVLIIDENHNSPRPAMPLDKGGFGVDAIWNNDFHNALYCRITGNVNGIFCDYSSPDKLVAAMQNGFAFKGQFSKYHKRAHGCDKQDLPGCKFVIYSQNHEHTSTTETNSREIHKFGHEAAKLCAGTVLLSPYTPLIFMGEEYGETAPFHYFSDSFKQNRITYQKETWDTTSSPFLTLKNIPDPEEKSTFTASRLNWKKKESEQGQIMFSFYKKLIELRRKHPALKEPCHSRCQVQEIQPGIILMIRNPLSCDKRYAAVIYNFNRVAVQEILSEHLPDGPWSLELYSAARAYGGYGPHLEKALIKGKAIELAPQSFALYIHTPLDIK